MSLTTPRTVVTAGASMFADALVRQAVDVVTEEVGEHAAPMAACLLTLREPDPHPHPMAGVGEHRQQLGVLLGALSYLLPVVLGGEGGGEGDGAVGDRLHVHARVGLAVRRDGDGRRLDSPPHVLGRVERRREDRVALDRLAEHRDVARDER